MSLDEPTVFLSITGLNSAFAFGFLFLACAGAMFDCLLTFRIVEAAGADSPNLSPFLLVFFGFPLTFWYERMVRSRSVICDVVELGEVD